MIFYLSAVLPKIVLKTSFQRCRTLQAIETTIPAVNSLVLLLRHWSGVWQNLLHLQQLYDAKEKAYKAAKAAAAAEREAAEREAAALGESINASAPAIHPAASEPTAASSTDDEQNNTYEPLAYLLDGTDSEAGEEDEAWDQYEEEEEPLDPELQVNNGTFHAQLQQQMGSINAARTAVPIVAQYLRGTACEDCAALLRGEFQFPLHLPDTLTASTSALENAKLPSRHLPPVLHEEKVLGKLMEIIMTLPQIRKFWLCSRQAEKKSLIIRLISLAAIRSVVLALNQDLKNKMKTRALKRKIGKLQWVMHL